MTRPREIILDILYPRGLVCSLCAREAVTKNGVCAACAAQLRICPQAPQCPGLDGCASGLLFTDVLRPAIHRFKYENQIWLAHELSQYLVPPEDWEIDVIMPVPLHPFRYAARGYNQSELLSRELGKRLGLPVDVRRLTRRRDTPTQTELGREARRRNMRNAFSAEECAGLRVLLIDDVRTTGSTLSACAEALRRAGAIRVYALTVAAAEL